MPVLLCLFLCWLIVSKTGAGNWVYLIGFFFGIGGSFMTAYKVWLAITGDKNNGGANDKEGRAKKKSDGDSERSIGFNDHL